MTALRKLKAAVAVVLILTLSAGVMALLRASTAANRTEITAYFDNTNGIFPGDEIRILGLAVGKIDTITPEPQRVRVTFWVDGQYQVPADAQAAILSPSLVSARAIQLVPAYTGGPVMASGGTIPQERTVVPVEWDDFREQLQKLTETLQPTQPGGVSTFGAFVNTAADNLRGQGANIRDALIKMSQAFSALGDHSKDIFGTVKSLSILVSALQASTDLMQQLNGNLASVSTLFANSPDEVGQAMDDLNTAVTDMQGFLAENTAAIGTTSDTVASISTAVTASLDDVKQALHVAPTTFSNFINVYQPAQNALTGVMGLNNFANPVSWLCGAVQAASRLNAEQSAKLCVQYLAPIIKNRQYNFPPVGLNPFVGTQARPNEVTYSEDWLRPDHQPASLPDEAAPASGPVADAPLAGGPMSAEQSTATDPGQGLTGLMVPAGAGS